MRDPEKARAARKQYEASARGKATRGKYRASATGKATRAKARRSEKGKEGQRRRSQRWADRHPEKAAAKIAAVAFHGQRMTAAAAMIHEGVPGSAQPLEFSESVALLKRDLWRDAAAAEEAGDHDEADRLYLEAHLVRPVPRPESQNPMVGIGGRQDREPLSSTDATAGDAILDWLGSAYGPAFGPHGPDG